MRKLNVLFLCTGNSCRSQMAEGWARALRGDVLEPYSAGIETHGLNPNAVSVMAEAGVDISGHVSKNVDSLAGVPFDCVVTVCGRANESCPFFPGSAKVVHVGFDDPPALAKFVEGEQAKLDCYRRVRDEIRAFVETLPEGLDRT
jgi:arsenate reductase (thioredoxin)